MKMPATKGPCCSGAPSWSCPIQPFSSTASTQLVIPFPEVPLARRGLPHDGHRSLICGTSHADRRQADQLRTTRHEGPKRPPSGWRLRHQTARE